MNYNCYFHLLYIFFSGVTKSYLWSPNSDTFGNTFHIIFTRFSQFYSFLIAMPFKPGDEVYFQISFGDGESWRQGIFVRSTHITTSPKKAVCMVSRQ